ncbi:MAG: hypothetical protein HYY52_02490 [Candidatus Melainabacteria bacterium]|nr:hypothetical protein [Candidatus Melainabacteria bacterium]
MKVNNISARVEDFVAKSYAVLCERKPDALNKDKVIQQEAIHTSDGVLLLRYLSYGGKLVASVDLLKTTEEGVSLQTKAEGPGTIYGIVGQLSPQMLVRWDEENPERLELRQKILADMLDALGSAVVGLSPDYVEMREKIIQKSPMRVVTHPADLPEDAEVHKEVRDILDLILKLADNPSQELLEKLEGYIVFPEGKGAKIYKIAG